MGRHSKTKYLVKELAFFKAVDQKLPLNKSTNDMLQISWVSEMTRRKRKSKEGSLSFVCEERGLLFPR